MQSQSFNCSKIKGMKKTFYTLTAVALLYLFLFNGCSKSTSSNNNNNNNNGSVSDLVASFVNTNSATGASTTYTFTYDAQNRLTEEQISDGTAPATYTYGSGTVTKTQGTTTTIYTLNNAGLATSDNQGNTYTYDGNGYLTNVTNTDGASTVNSISNGNITTSVQTTSTGTTTTYTYTFISKANTIKFGDTFTGSPDASLFQAEGINGINYAFTYTYDSHGRAATLKIVSGATTLARTYTYIN
jgi:YD repeat-containing protein